MNRREFCAATAGIILLPAIPAELELTSAPQCLLIRRNINFHPQHNMRPGEVQLYCSSSIQAVKFDIDYIPLRTPIIDSYSKMMTADFIATYTPGSCGPRFSILKNRRGSTCTDVKLFEFTSHIYDYEAIIIKWLHTLGPKNLVKKRPQTLIKYEF